MRLLLSGLCWGLTMELTGERIMNNENGKYDAADLTQPHVHEHVPTKTTATGTEISELSLNELLSLIDEAECISRKNRNVLLDLQHKYLEAVGFKIEAAQGGFISDLVYRKDDDVFIDVDHAMEYAID